MSASLVGSEMCIRDRCSSISSSCAAWLLPHASRASAAGTISPACATRASSIDRWIAPLPSRASGGARGK
eukprot:10372335-Alexandrium_andersonii.AAC.1